MSSGIQHGAVSRFVQLCSNRSMQHVHLASNPVPEVQVSDRFLGITIALVCYEKASCCICQLATLVSSLPGPPNRRIQRLHVVLTKVAQPSHLNWATVYSMLVLDGQVEPTALVTLKAGIWFEDVFHLGWQVITSAWPCAAW